MSAKICGFFIQRYRVAPRPRHPRRLHARDPAADDDYLPRPGRWAQRRRCGFRSAAGRIHRTTQVSTRERSVQTAVMTADTWTDILGPALEHLLGPLGVGEQCFAQHDDIRLVLIQHLLGHRGQAQPAGRENRDANRLFYLLDQIGGETMREIIWSFQSAESRSRHFACIGVSPMHGLTELQRMPLPT